MWNAVLNSVVKFSVLLVLISNDCEGICTPIYGGEPCSYIPAPPGKTPPCARPGDTFCEQVEQYPMHHIRFLIDKWGYDYSTLLNDESRDEYSTYFTQPDYGYGPYQAPGYHHGEGYSYPEPIYIPKPPSAATPPLLHPSNKYIPPRLNHSDTFLGYPDRRQPLKYPGYNPVPPGNHLGAHNGFRGHPHHGYFVPSQTPAAYHGSHHGQGLPYFDPNNWWRYTRDNKNTLSQPYTRSKRSSNPSQKHKVTRKKKKIKKPLYGNNRNATNSVIHNRKKRQSGTLGSAQQLCSTRSQFIMPQAALNNRGNWMYVVNLQEQNNQYTQLVRSETCVSQQCSALCGVPTGYTARCEQRYVQKRLVALESRGQNLYTDVFWFPSCCICTVTGG